MLKEEIFPEFNGNPQDGADIALLYLKEDVNVSMPSLPSPEAPLWEGQRMIGLGWGITGDNDGQVPDTTVLCAKSNCLNCNLSGFFVKLMVDK